MNKKELKEFDEKAINISKYAIGENYPNNEIYQIPFTILDNTPNGKSYGRIMWNIEIITGCKSKGGCSKFKRYWIEKIYVWASQTRDEEIADKVFKLDLFCKMFMNRNKIEISNIEPCSEHRKGTIISFYPNSTQSNKAILEISATTSVAFDFNIIYKE